MTDYYSVQRSGALESLMAEIDRLQARIAEKKPLQPDKWQAVTEKLKIEWTCDSNAIEGSTLTLGETIFFLREGLTVEGKPLKDFVDARNHADAIDFLCEVVSNKRSLTEGLLKEIDALLLKGVEFTEAVDPSGNKTNKKATPGQYKKTYNTVLVAHLLRRGGEAGVRRLIEALGRGQPAAEALLAVFSLSYAELQRDWEAHLESVRGAGL